MILLLLFVLGTQVGSFLNVCIYRLPRRESIVHPPSHCPYCNTRLKGWDLVPLLSQLLLGSRCRYCRHPYSWRYFWVEAVTGTLFVLVGLQAGNLTPGGWGAAWVGDPVRLVRDLIFVSTLVVIFLVDYDTRLIQLESVLLLGWCGVAWDLLQCVRDGRHLTRMEIASGLPPVLSVALPQSLAALLVAAGFIWLIRLVASLIFRREAMGFGDVMLVAAIAANLGWSSLLVTFFFLSVVVGAVVGVLVAVPRAIRAYRWASRRRRKWPAFQWHPLLLARRAFRHTIAFGPMLACGAITALLFGDWINHAYLLWIGAG